MNPQKQAYLLGLIAVLMWSTVATAFKLALKVLTPFQLVTLSALVSWLILSFFLIYQGEFKKIFSIPKKVLRKQLFLGWLNPLGYYCILFAAYDRLPAQEAQSLNYTWAITLMLLSVPVLGHKVTIKDGFSSLVAYVGVLIIATHGDLLSFEFSQPVGVALALFSTLIWSIFWLVNAKSQLSPVLSLWLNFSGALPFLLLGYFLFYSSVQLTWEAIAGATYVGIFEMGLAFICWLMAMRLTEHTSKISNLIFLAPPLSLFLIWTVLDEPILSSTLLGLAFILLGLALQKLTSGFKSGKVS